MKILIVIFELCLVTSYVDIINSSQSIQPTVGGVWPRPKSIKGTNYYFQIDPHDFDFVVVGYTCDILQDALIRYKKIIKLTMKSLIRNENIKLIKRPLTLAKFSVNLTAVCEYMPHFEMDEEYSIESASGQIMSHSIWGMLRALETLSQLITPDSKNMLRIREVRIDDRPRFPHRGLLLDTARHYISISTIYTILDGMACNKLNVFHWHIVDDESFPYQSINYPELSEKGAYRPSMIYTQKNISDIIEYARLRGIRVVAEFDIPGHTRSLENSHPEILTKCGETNSFKFGPLNPIANTTYDFLEKFFSEVVKVFPDKYVHIGGDEVDFKCWESNKEVRQYVKANNITYQQLQHKIMQHVSKLLTNKTFTPIVWQEAMIGNVKLPKETVIQIWTGNWRDLFTQFTNSGYRVLLSECWYLDHLQTGGDWDQFYRCEPLDFRGSGDQRKSVIGGEACMWGENVNDYNVIQRIFPRVCAAAEKLWCLKHVHAKIPQRLEEHTCRMQKRGIHAQPANGPGVC